jgi:hypothetical protein
MTSMGGSIARGRRKFGNLLSYQTIAHGLYVDFYKERKFGLLPLLIFNPSHKGNCALWKLL